MAWCGPVVGQDGCVQTTPRNLWHVLCGVALVSAMVLSGCQSADRVSSPPASTAPVATSAAPVGSAAPTPTATPTPTTPSRLVVTARPTTPEETAALVAEAEHVYREHQRLIDQYEAQGGAASLPEPLKQYVAGRYAVAVERSLRSLSDASQRIEEPSVVHRGQVFLEVTDPASLIGVEFCNDLSQQILIDKDGQRYPGNARLRNRAEFSRGPDGRLRMTNNSSKEVPSCGA